MLETMELDAIYGSALILYDLCKGTRIPWLLTNTISGFRSGDH